MMAVPGDMAQSAKMHNNKLYASTENKHKICMSLLNIYIVKDTQVTYNNPGPMLHTYVLHRITGLKRNISFEG